MWKVTAIGQDTGKEYVYRVDGPWDAGEMDVKLEAYRAHGMLKAHLTVTEYLSPANCTVRWVDGV